MENFDINPNVFMCSFDVSSLFTKVPLDETIKICSEVLYDESDLQPFIPKGVFVELMKSATSLVEFSLNNTMYKQTDGVAMGSPFALALANIFVLDIIKKSYFLKRRSLQHTSEMLTTREAEADEFLTKLNCFHPSLRFTFEKEKGKRLPFLDVYVERTDVGLETSVYR